MAVAMQKALFLTEKHGPWKIDKRPIPHPGKGELLVKIDAAALNPVDWKIQKDGLFIDNYPAVIGQDSAGEVAQVGEGVTNFKKGDRVLNQGWFRENDKSTFQQYTIVPAEIVAKIPPNLSYNDAATIPLGLATAFVGLYNPLNQQGIGLTPFWTQDGRNKYANKPVVILGGAASIGQYAIQGARLSGFNPIITTASPQNSDYLKSIGATFVLDRNLSEEAIVAGIKAHLPKGQKGVEFVYDAISEPDSQSIALAVSAPNARILVTLPQSLKLDFGERTVVNTFGNVHAQRQLGVELYKALPALLEKGELKPNRVEFLKGGLGAIPDGLERMAQRKVSGVKLVVNPQE